MARPLKNGVSYFPKDTDYYYDDKVRILRAEFGAKGMYALDFLLCELYRQYGYYLPWDNSRCFLVSDGAGCGCDPGYIKEFVNGCIRCSFFDKRVFDMFGVLTSSGIQRRYLRMLNNRSNIPIYEEYWLLESDDQNDVPTGVLNKITFKRVSSNGNPLKSNENPLKSNENPLNKSKNKNKANKINNSSEQDEPAREPVIRIILNDGRYHSVYQEDIDRWSELYPAVDIIQELRKMVGWCDANPKYRKTKTGINRFVNAWLSKAQDQGGRSIQGPTATKNFNTPGRYDDYKVGDSNGF